MATAPALTSFAFGRINMEDGNAFSKNNTDVQRYSLGLTGEINESWRWDLSATMARNTYHSESSNNRLADRWTNGLDAVASGGQVVCRITRDNPNANDTTDPYRDIRDCKPINPFGAGSINATALAYYRGTSIIDADIEQDVYAFNISGEPFKTPGGPISVAAGAEHRRESTVQRSDRDSTLRRWRSINAQPFSGEYDVDEGYVEFAAPLAAGQPLADHFDVNGAFRYTDYSTSGPVRTWKIGLNYAPVSVLRFRGVVSQDIRAPNNFELYSNGNQVLSPLVDPRDNQSRTVLQITRGNSLLKPEKALTHSFGVVYQGEDGWLSNFRASIDYYEININQAVTNPAPQDIVNFCFQGQTQFCSGVILSPTTNLISQVNVSPFNADTQKTSGLDMEASYRFDNVAGGDLTVRLLSNFVRELTTIANGVANDYVGLAGLSPPPTGVPEWRTNVDFNWRRDALRLGLGYRFMGGGKFDTRFNITQLDLQNNDIKGRSYVDINASYDVTKNYSVYGRVENLFDVDPPITPNAINQPTVANSQFFDRRGLFWTVGGRVKF
jgi:outer membrane receptor protein involved in Fe transport